ncbi:polyprenyl synthetase family protein [Streptomyces sp. NPDC090106]|uniref:polyprenyl synthetase family protein n=1 Tax=Streptomyces sp. NPDC090106 TaxID=3365946 RepID=UPI0037F8D567
MNDKEAGAPSPSRGIGLRIRHRRLHRRITGQLASVENVLLDSAKSDIPLLGEAAEHLIKAGGKRLRPALTLLAAQFGDPYAPGVVEAAAAVELTHLATLHHDDVMDQAPVRRDVPSVNARWGNLVAVRSGDFLLSRAAQLVAAIGEHAIRAQEGVISRLVRGQALELSGPGPGDDPVAHYMDVIGDKTGSLIALAARLGALLSGADQETVARFSEFGERIGVVFQLADDIIDIQGGSSGKTAGTDLLHGVPTLPVLMLKSRWADGTGPQDARLRVLIGEGPTTREQRHEALTLLRRHPVLAEARAYTCDQARKAAGILAQLPPCDAKDALDDLCGTLAGRMA